MHYGIIAIGSRGDVQPFVALATGLLDRGHHVTLMAHENFKDFVEGYGIGFHPLPGNVEAMLYSPKGRKVLKSGNMLVFMHFVNKEVSKNQAQVNQAIVAGAQKADVLVTSLVGMIWTDAIAESSGKPWAAIQLSFPSTPTREFPFALLSFFDNPQYNRLTYRVFDYLYNKDYKKQLNKFRQSLGLPVINTSVLKKIAAENTPNLYAISPTVLPRPTDWPPHNQITGFIHLPREKRSRVAEEIPPKKLIRWLESDSQPIYIGFGSIPIPDPPKFIHILKELLSKSSYRFLFCQGWSKTPGLPEHPRLFIVSTANHEWLFPRCRAAIIHGGVGTVAAGLKAKTPLVIASIFADQPWWGKRVERSGLGIHLPFRQWTSEKLLAAIRKTETPEIQNRVKEVGAQLGREDGLNQTIEALERYFSA